MTNITNIKKKKIIVLDYDNTLFPTLYFKSLLKNVPQDNIYCNYFNNKNETELLNLIKEDDVSSEKLIVTVPIVSVFNKLDIILESFILKLLEIGKIFIITAANSSWVNMTAKDFLPKFYSLISKMTLLSAKDLYESKYPIGHDLESTISKWKYTTMVDYILPLCRNERVNNIISIGDTYSDMEYITLFGEVYSIKYIFFKLHSAPDTIIMSSQLLGIMNVIDIIAEGTESKIIDVDISFTV